jgi:glycosyltransferase involved in cell wall biosynthesis
MLRTVLLPRRVDTALRRVTHQRLRTLALATGASAGASPAGTREAVHDLISREGADAVWLCVAALHARIPDADTVRALWRRTELEGATAVLTEIEAGIPQATLDHKVRIAQDVTLVDVHQLIRTPFTSGIQRVTQETVRRWHRDHTIELVAWTAGFGALREPTTTERAKVLGAAARGASRSGSVTVVVPWRARYLLPEVALDPARTVRMRTIAMHSRSRTAAIGFDMVPITISETTNVGVPSDFAHQLTALRHMDRLAAISDTTRVEFEGWRTMLTAIGLEGPQVAAVPLAVEAHEPDEAEVAAARRRHVIPTVPLVLCVGSHEPRKNHLAVLHAAELLWRRGLEFSLLFVGPTSWGGHRFRLRLNDLAAAGRQVQALNEVADPELWALYRLARCTVFPSLSEGYGLPVAESLASGTPVVTTRYGSMADIAAGGGALLVDPRDTGSLAEALAALLTDDALHRRLSSEARARPVCSWDDYAGEAWDFLTSD